LVLDDGTVGGGASVAAVAAEAVVAAAVAAVAAGIGVEEKEADADDTMAGGKARCSLQFLVYPLGARTTMRVAHSARSCICSTVLYL
jgi:hypothetical protein